MGFFNNKAIKNEIAKISTEKVITFVVNKVREFGPQNAEIMFPFKGEVNLVYASTTSKNPMVNGVDIAVEKGDGSTWEEIARLNFDGEHYYKETQELSNSIDNEFVRINIINTDEEAEEITIEGLVVGVKVKI